ncbi:MAG: alpha/beta hydrolase [Trichocoleus desertorum ATA4-8-CV12]|jgi:pimeloyl-ACP methyl ester carboxylesterase|nr:alpha/beta hydrolase [Trichocoleus desertorum ATA4-8-CV12]
MNFDRIPLHDQLRLPDGRTLSYAIYGTPGGQPVYFFHGFPGSRLHAELGHEDAIATGVCLVAFDRPGFGRSSWVDAPTIDHIISDVSVLADYLGHRRFGVLGVSCGGPYALASARLMPTRVSAVGLLAGMGPMNIPSLRKHQMRVLKFMFAAAKTLPLAITPLLFADSTIFRRDAERAVEILSRALPPPDRALLAENVKVRERFAAGMAEAYRQGISGSLSEARRISKQGTAQLREISCPVHVYQGDLDRHVPVAMGEFLASHLPGGRFHLRTGEGHLSIVSHCIRECLKLLSSNMKSEISIYDLVPKSVEIENA